MADSAPEALRQVFSSDGGGGTVESAFVDSTSLDGAESIRIERGGTDARSASADLGQRGQLDEQIAGRASPKDASELRAAAGLVERLNRDGAHWSLPVLVNARGRDESGVDCISTGEHGEELQLQVTTVEREAWADLARVPLITRSSETPTRAVEAILNAIRAKGSVDGRDTITLVIDATDSPSASLRSVVMAFRRQHGRWTAQQGHQAVWVVGPVVDLVSRLDAD